MNRLSAIALMFVIFLCGCSGSTLENIGKEAADQISNISDANNKYVHIVKNGYREDNPKLTYDEAFKEFFASPTWKYIKGDGGENVVEFTGDCMYQDVKVKARLQFIVDEDEGTFEAGYLAFNEVPQNNIVKLSLLANVFGLDGYTEEEDVAVFNESNESNVEAEEADYPSSPAELEAEFELEAEPEHEGEVHSNQSDKEDYLRSLLYIKALEDDISEAMTTFDMNEAIGKAHNAWDDELNKIYGLLMDSMSQQNKEALRTVQRNWIKTRDAEAEEAMEEYAGGTLATVEGNISLMETTKERTLELIDIYFSGSKDFEPKENASGQDLWESIN